MNPDGWRSQNVGRYLNRAVRRFENKVLELLRKSGHGKLTLGHISLTRNLDIAGTRLTELARRAAMTKQSMGELTEQIEKLGLIVRKPDPNDGRARLVQFTPAGLAWLEAFRVALRKTEAEMRDELGDQTFEVVTTSLAAYADREGRRSPRVPPKRRKRCRVP